MPDPPPWENVPLANVPKGDNPLEVYPQWSGPLEVKDGELYALPISMPPLPSFPYSATHYMYFRPHAPRGDPPTLSPYNVPTPRQQRDLDDRRVAHRALFLANIPVDSTAPHLRAVFSAQIGLPAAGRIERVEFRPRPQDAENPEDEVGLVARERAWREERGRLRDSTTGDRHQRQTEGEKRKKKNGSSGSSSSSKRKRDGSATDPGMTAAADDAGGAGVPGTKIGPDLPPVWDRKLHPPGTTALVVFVDRQAMLAALGAAKKARGRLRIVWGEGIEEHDERTIPKLGFERYLNHAILTFPDPDDLLANVNEFMANYNIREENLEREQRLDAQRSGQPDADGFVTVVRGSKGASASNPTAASSSAAAAESRRLAEQESARLRLKKQQARRKGLDLLDFYRFQGRERRKAREMELRKRFEQDRLKLKKIRERRDRVIPE